MIRATALIILLVVLVGFVYIRHQTEIQYHIARSLPFTHSCTSTANSKILDLIKSLQDLGIPGGQISFISKTTPSIDCAFGWGGSKGLFSPVSLADHFRYASLAKIFTSLTALRLVSEGKMPLDRLVLPRLGDYDKLQDLRLLTITFRHLLTHRAGFDRIRSGDPMLQVAPWCPYDLKTLNQLKLDYSPGQHYSYSNLGYCLLGEALARSADTSLETLFINTLEVAQYSSIQEVTNSTISSKEVHYMFDYPDSEKTLLSFDYHAMLASGGWTGTASDLALLISRNLNDAKLSVFEGFEPACDFSLWRTCHGYVFYKYQKDTQHVMYWRDGSLPGVTAFAAATSEGEVIILLANYREYKWLKFNDAIGQQLYQYLGDKVSSNEGS